MKINLLLLPTLLVLFACKKETKAPPQLPLLNVVNTQAQETAGKISFSVTLSKSSSSPVKVNFQTTDGTAKAGTDYTAAKGEITFQANEIEKIVEINLLNNNEFKGERTLNVQLSNPSNAKLNQAQASGIIIEDEVPNTGYSTPNTYAGYNLVWSDEFKGTTLDPANWTHEIGTGCPNVCGWGNNELQYYRAENSYMHQSDYLVIEARKENFQGSNYTSSRIITQNKQKFTYGRVDIRAALPKGQGIWPALWMLGNNISTVGWPACGEIDIMEVLGQEPNKLYGTVHWDNNGQHAQYGGNTTLSSGDFYSKFHVFSITWDSQKIRWFLDDVKFHEIDITPTGLSEFQKEHFFIFNIAVGGNWPGNPNNFTIFPQRMVVDYIRVFQQTQN
jgi:beta-glucanase (GH16 family)